MTEEERLSAFEKMLDGVLTDYRSTVGRLAQLKAAGKEKTATYRQLLGNKLELQNILSRYKVYGLLDLKEEGKTGEKEEVHG